MCPCHSVVQSSERGGTKEEERRRGGANPRDSLSNREGLPFHTDDNKSLLQSCAPPTPNEREVRSDWYPPTQHTHPPTPTHTHTPTLTSTPASASASATTTTKTTTRYSGNTLDRLAMLCNGVDTAAVVPKSEPKSLLAVKSFSPPVATIAELTRWLTILLTELEDRIVTHGELFGTRPNSMVLHHKGSWDAGRVAGSVSRTGRMPTHTPTTARMVSNQPAVV
jgi:hypothetical protein